MELIKRKYICIIFIFIICVSNHIQVYGKYIFDKTFDAVQLNIDREKPVLKISQVKQERINQKEQKITVWINVEEKNLKEDTILPNEVEIYIDSKKVDASQLICTKQENETEERSKWFRIEIAQIPIGEKTQIKIKEGALVDAIGWKSSEYTETLEEKF